MMKVSTLICTPVLLLALLGITSNHHGNVGQTASGPSPEATFGKIFDAPASVSFTQARTSFSSKEGKFSITLPAGYPDFIRKVQSQTTAVGNIDLYLYSSETPRGAYIVSHSYYPSATFQGRSTQQMLEDGRDGALKSVNGVLEKQKNITIQGHPGISVFGSITKGTAQIYFRFDYLMVQPRFYQIGYLAYNKASLESDEVLNVFKSFRLDE